MFAGFQSQFLGAFLPQAQSLVQAGRNTLAQALIVFFYITFFFHISVTISSLVLIDEFGGMQVRAARSPQDGPEETDEETLRLLKKYNGGRRIWKWVIWHCRPCHTLDHTTTKTMAFSRAILAYDWNSDICHTTRYLCMR